MISCPSCGTLHSHPTRSLCSLCSGWACSICGCPKTPEKTVCNSEICLKKFRRGQEKRAKVEKERQEKRRETLEKMGWTDDKRDDRDREQDPTLAKVIPLSIVPRVENGD